MCVCFITAGPITKLLQCRVFKIPHPLCFPPPSVSRPLAGGPGAGRSAAEVRAGTRVFKSPTPLGVPPPYWGARRGPERSGGPRRDSSL
jgi:hypothetical protein